MATLPVYMLLEDLHPELRVDGFNAPATSTWYDKVEGEIAPSIWEETVTRFPKTSEPLGPKRRCDRRRLGVSQPVPASSV